MTDEANAGEDRAVRALIQRALREEMPPKGPLLPGVQRKLRLRSNGKFFSDGWSTTRTLTPFLAIAVATLLLLAVAYLALGPTGLVPS